MDALALALDDSRYRALVARDPRFDGQFFVAVRTTGIFCRVVCTARKPLRRNVDFYPSAAAAFEAGFRPCLRCRPELAPELSRTLGNSSYVARAMRWIDDGALDAGSTRELAARIGITDRHLRRLFDEHLGASPIAVAQVRRLLFAKQLIESSTLPLIDVASAAGYKSVRRFNDAVLAAYARAPSALRARRKAGPGAGALTLRLGYLGEYDWAATIAYLAGRAFAGVEIVTPQAWQRAIVIDGTPGWVEVRHAPQSRALVLQAHVPKMRHLGDVVRCVRQVFDLDANAPRIAEHLGADPLLRRGVQARPGLRVPGAWHPFEIAVRAILGQQVSVAAATTLAARLVARWGEMLSANDAFPAGLTHAFPRPDQLADAPIEEVGIVRQRAAAIRALSQRMVAFPAFLEQFDGLDAAVSALCELPGIGPWTAQYIAMRALRECDAFAAGDLGVRRALEAAGVHGERGIVAYAQRWRPWRAYAVMHLWHLPLDHAVKKIRRIR